jgi:sugar/nucleoside kinase (ribokinase family)
MVLVVGGVSYDTMIYLNELPAPVPATLFAKGTHTTVGSTGTGKALALHRLGLATTLHGYVGDDEAGTDIRAYFQREGLLFVYELDPAGTERHINIMDVDGGRISIYVNSATFAPPVNHTTIAPLIAQSDIVALNIMNYCRELIPTIQQAGKPIWCDVHDYDGQNPYHADFVTAADVLFVSGDKLSNPRPFMENMVGTGKQFVVCTFGKEGSLALDHHGSWIETPALPYPLVDSNGAGDNFFAGVLYGVSRGYPLEVALRLGTVVGGLCVTSRELVAEGLSKEMVWREYRRVWR